MVIVTQDAIDPLAAYGLISREVSGSILLHYAVVKKNASDKPTNCIEYTSQGDSEGELINIAVDLQLKWNLEDVLLIRRTGCLVVGEIISLVAASSPNSEDAFEACKWGISRLKTMKTITKSEKFDITNTHQRRNK